MLRTLSTMAPLALTFLTAPADAAPPVPVQHNPTVTTSYGVLQGRTGNAVNSFLGVPYAAPPVGNLRFRPPASASTWTGVRQAAQFGPSCLQPPSIFGTASQAEDCLYLNVYTPAAVTSRRPVMVFIHGGAFGAGEGSDYDGSDLVRHGGVVVVTINYRLGVLGFLAAPSLDAEGGTGTSGNWGLMDQQAALRWVRLNIAAFGGDPSNVTVFGESAGGASVIDQLGSPTASGLFDKALIESGGYSPTLPSLAQAEQNAQLFEEAVGCGSNPTASCLRAVPATLIYTLSAAVTATFSLSTLNMFGPVAAAPVLPVAPLKAIASGRFNNVPVLDGSNHDEFTLFVALAYDLQRPPLTAGEYPDAVASSVGSAVAPAVLQRYPLSNYPSPDVALSTVLTDSAFSCGRALVDNVLYGAGRAPYSYEFNTPNAKMLFVQPASFPYGDAHTDELGYLFPTLHGNRGQGTENFSPSQGQLSLTMQAQWTQFASTGSPNGTGLPTWPAFSGPAGAIQSLTTPAQTTRTNFSADHQCGFWGPLLAAEAGLPGSAGQL